MPPDDAAKVVERSEVRPFPAAVYTAVGVRRGSRNRVRVHAAGGASDQDWSMVMSLGYLDTASPPGIHRAARATMRARYSGCITRSPHPIFGTYHLLGCSRFSPRGSMTSTRLSSRRTTESTARSSIPAGGSTKRLSEMRTTLRTSSTRSPNGPPPTSRISMCRRANVFHRYSKLATGGVKANQSSHARSLSDAIVE